MSRRGHWPGAPARRRLHQETQDLLHRRRAPRDELPQILALEKLGDDVGDAFVRSHVVNGEDVGVVEGGDGPRLPFEEAEALGIAGHLLRQHLDRDVAAEAGITGAVDLPHAAGPEELDDLVGSELCVTRKRHGTLEVEHDAEAADAWRQDLVDAVEHRRRGVEVPLQDRV